MAVLTHSASWALGARQGGAKVQVLPKHLAVEKEIGLMSLGWRMEELQEASLNEGNLDKRPQLTSLMLFESCLSSVLSGLRLRLASCYSDRQESN